MIVSFLGEHVIEVIFGLISAGLLAFCKYLNGQMKNYKTLLEEKENEKVEEIINNRLQSIQEALDDLHANITAINTTEKHHLDLILDAYRYVLVQLCKDYIKQGYIKQTQYDQLSEFYKIYSALGGNGQAQEYYEKAMQLKIHSSD